MRLGGVVGRCGGQRPVAVLLDADDLHRVQIDDRPNALDGPGVAVVGRVAAEEAERPGEAAVAVFLGAVVAGAPDIDHDQAGIVDAGVLLEGRLELGGGQHGLLAFDLLVDGHGRLHAGDVLPVQQLFLGQRNDGFIAGVGAVVEQDGERFARRRCRAMDRVPCPARGGRPIRSG